VPAQEPLAVNQNATATGNSALNPNTDVLALFGVRLRTAF
jgi:hypothetical protein